MQFGETILCASLFNSLVSVFKQFPAPNELPQSIYLKLSSFIGSPRLNILLGDRLKINLANE